MIQSIHIQNFKSIENQAFDFKPLTILTGTNSAGKSSIIQAILLYSHRFNGNMLLDDYLANLGKPSELLYIHSKDEFFLINLKVASVKTASLIFDKNKQSYRFDETEKKEALFTLYTKDMLIPSFEKNLYYISANRIGQENQSKIKEKIRCGVNGEYIFGFYESYKHVRLENEKLISQRATSKALNAQVNFWLSKILDLNLMPITQTIDNTSVKVFYQNFDLDDIEMPPFNLGAGVSYLTKILILGLSLKEGDILIVENPEVHLHPKAISRFAEFFKLLVKGGIQVILETHSEHIINKMRYFVFKGQLSSKEVQIYYRERFDKPFDSIRINDKGKYINVDDEIIEFPAGFFDSDLDELLEMM